MNTIRKPTVYVIEFVFPANKRENKITMEIFLNLNKSVKYNFLRNNKTENIPFLTTKSMCCKQSPLFFMEVSVFSS